MKVTDSSTPISRRTTPGISDARAPSGVKRIEVDNFKTLTAGDSGDVLHLSPGYFGGAET